MPIIDVVNEWLVFPLLGIVEFHHYYISSGTIKVIEEFVLHLVPTINVLKCKVYVPIKFVPLEGTDNLFN